jgi:hypothetical protein
MMSALTRTIGVSSFHINAQAEISDQQTNSIFPASLPIPPLQSSVSDYLADLLWSQILLNALF